MKYTFTTTAPLPDGLIVPDGAIEVSADVQIKTHVTLNTVLPAERVEALTAAVSAALASRFEGAQTELTATQP